MHDSTMLIDTFLALTYVCKCKEDKGIPYTGNLCRVKTFEFVTRPNHLEQTFAVCSLVQHLYLLFSTSKSTA